MSTRWGWQFAKANRMIFALGADGMIFSENPANC